MADRRPIAVEPLNDQGLPAVLAITAPGCHHCKAVRPRLEMAAAGHDDIRYLEISAPEHPEVVAAHNVRGIPTILAIRDGRVVGRQVGAGSQSDVERMFRVAGGGPGTRGVLGGTDRLLRTAAGAVLAVVGYLAVAWWLTAIGVLLLAAGWYDLAIPRNRAKDGRTYSRSLPPSKFSDDKAECHLP